MKGYRNSSIWGVEAALQLDARMRTYRPYRDEFIVSGRGHGKSHALEVARQLAVYGDVLVDQDGSIVPREAEGLWRYFQSIKPRNILAEYVAARMFAPAVPYVAPEIAGVRWACRPPSQPPTQLELLMQRWFNDPVAKARMQAILDRKAAKDHG